MSQFKDMKDPPLHQFVVFSVIHDDGNIIPKYVQCNNCYIVHKVTDICRSEILETKESMSSITTLEDIKAGINPALASILERNMADLPTWEACQHALENKQWGQHVVITSDMEEGNKVIKYVRILGESLFKVETYTRTEVVTYE